MRVNVNIDIRSVDDGRLLIGYEGDVHTDDKAELNILAARVHEMVRRSEVAE